MSSVQGWMDRPGEFAVAMDPIAVVPDVDDLAAVEQLAHDRGGQHLIVGNLSLILMIDAIDWNLSYV